MAWFSLLALLANTVVWFWVSIVIQISREYVLLPWTGALAIISLLGLVNAFSMREKRDDP